MTWNTIGKVLAGVLAVYLCREGYKAVRRRTSLKAIYRENEGYTVKVLKNQEVYNQLVMNASTDDLVKHQQWLREQEQEAKKRLDAAVEQEQQRVDQLATPKKRKKRRRGKNAA